MSPTTTFRTEQYLISVIQESNTPHLIVQIRFIFLMDKRFHLPCLHVHHTNIRFIPRTLISLEIKTFPVIATINDIYILIRPTVNINLPHLPRIGIPNNQTMLNNMFITCHLVFIGFQLGTRLRKHIHNPHIIHFTSILPQSIKFISFFKPLGFTEETPI